MRRVVIVGVAGSGKSTVARELSQHLGVPHIELDAIFWQANWTKLDEDEFEARVRAVTCSEGWVVDGNYSARIRRVTWTAADTVVWLDLPRPVVMWQLFWRTLRRSVSGAELWNGNRERPLRDQFGRDPAKSICGGPGAPISRRSSNTAKACTTRSGPTSSSAGCDRAGRSNGSSVALPDHAQDGTL